MPKPDALSSLVTAANWRKLYYTTGESPAERAERLIRDAADDLERTADNLEPGDPARDVLRDLCDRLWTLSEVVQGATCRADELAGEEELKDPTFPVRCAECGTRFLTRDLGGSEGLATCSCGSADLEAL